MKDFIERLIARLEDPNLTNEQKELIIDLLRQQADLEKSLLDQINRVLERKK